MTDEKFTFIEDLREKKRTATGAYHKRTHCGKGGAVRFPSDYKTAKELRAMNGEVKEYRLNDPVRWGEFKEWPDDIKVLYIKSLRKAYNVSDTRIMEMMGVSGITLCKEMKRLGISTGQRSGRTKWDKDGWYAWVNGVPVEAKEDVAKERTPEMERLAETARIVFDLRKLEAKEAPVEWLPEDNDSGKSLLDEGDNQAKETEKCDCTHAIPGWGQMELEGTVEECAKTLQMLLADKRVKLAVSWTVVE